MPPRWIPLDRALRLTGAGVLLVVALSMPPMGYAAAEQFEGRRFYSVFEGDWFGIFSLVAAGACIWAAVQLARPQRPSAT